MQPNLMNVAMRNGLILGVLFTTNFFLANPAVPLLGLLSYAMKGFILYLTYKYTVKFRDNNRAGAISFGQAGTFVFLMFFFASLISALVKLVYVKYINTDFLSNMFNQSMMAIEKILPNVSEETYEMMEEMLQPINYTMMSMFVNLFWGVIISVIIALIVKKTVNPFQNNRMDLNKEN